MNGLDILIVGLGRRPRTELTERFARLGHDVTRSDQVTGRSPAPGSCDVVVVDAAARGIGRDEVARIRTGFRRPVLVVGEQPACLSGIDGAMFCFADAGDNGHDLAVRMCLALSPLVACEPTPCLSTLDLCMPRALVPAHQWRARTPVRGVSSRT